MDYLKKFVNEYCENIAYKNEFNSDDCKMLEKWILKIKNPYLTRDEMEVIFAGNYPVTSTYICNKLVLNNDVIDWCIKNCDDNRILKALMMQNLSDSQLMALKNKLGFAEMNHTLYDKHYAPLISNNCVDYIAKIAFESTSAIFDSYDKKNQFYISLSLTKNENLIKSFMENETLINEQKLSAIVNNEYISKDIRIKAFNMGCDYTILNFDKILPDEILTDVYHSFADAHTEHHTMWTTFGTDLAFTKLMTNKFLPHECQMDYLMRWMNSRAQDSFLQGMISNTTDCEILEKATKLKSKVSNMVYENPHTTKKCIEERFENLYKKASKEYKNTGYINNLTVNRLIDCINKLTLSKYHTDLLFELNNNFININLLRRNIYDRTKINLADLEKYMHSSDGWCRFYATLSYNIHSNKNAEKYTASNKEQIYEIIKCLHFMGYEHHSVPWPKFDTEQYGICLKDGEDIKLSRQNEVLLSQKRSLCDLIFSTIKQAEIDANFEIGSYFDDYHNNIEIRRKWQQHLNGDAIKNKDILKCELREIAGLYNAKIDKPKYVYSIDNPVVAMQFYKSLAGFINQIEENYKEIKNFEKEERKTEMEI